MSVCAHFLSYKKTAIPACHHRGLNEFALCAHTHTHTHTHTHILSISLSSKQNMTDWQTDCAGNRLTDRRTHAAQTDRANTQTAICTYSTTEGGLPLAPTYAHALAHTHAFGAELKNVTVSVLCFFFFFSRSFPSESVSLYSCVTVISIRVSNMFLLSFFSSALIFSTHPSLHTFLPTACCPRNKI